MEIIRNFLLLVLVFGISSLASATPEFYFYDEPLDNFIGMGPFSTITVQVYSDASWCGYIIVEKPYDESVVLANPTPAEFAQPCSEQGWGTGFFISGQAGVWHTIDIVSSAPGFDCVSLWDISLGYDAPVDYFKVWHAGAPPTGESIHASAAGPYQTCPGKTVTLGGWRSNGFFFSIDEYRWTIGGQYVGDAEMLPLSYDTLVNVLGLPIGIHEVELRVSGNGLVDYDYTTIEILSRPCDVPTFTVINDGSGDYSTIQAAVDGVRATYAIVVADGTYTGDGNRDIVFNGKPLTLKSENGPTNCIIDCQGSAGEPHRVFIFYSGGCLNSVVQGFTITGGYEEYGGGIYCFGGDPSPKITNCIFVDNFASSIGGGVVCRFDSSSQTVPEPNIINCTFIGNSAVEGGSAVAGLFLTLPTLHNCIIWANEPNDEPGIFSIGLWTIPVNFSILQSSWEDNPSIEGQGNMVADPCFVDADDGDYHLKSEIGRWDQSTESWVMDDVTSSAIDAGDPNSDWTAELWSHGKRINMGAYGGTHQASMSLSNIGNVADLSNDDFVSYDDLKLLSDKWICQEPLLAEDLDRDRIVNLIDFAIFADNWLWQQ